MNRQVIRWSGIVAVALATLLVTAMPVLVPGRSVYDSTVAITWAMTLAIIATAVFAAENLIEFRQASEAEWTPVLDPQLTLSHAGRKSTISLQLTNVGRGIAVAVEASLWWTDSDMVTWLPHRIDNLDDVLRPGDRSHGSLEESQLHFVVHKHFRPGTPQLVLQVRYRDGRRRSEEEYHAYELSSDDHGRPVITDSPHGTPEDLKSVRGKQRLLREEADRVAAEFDLETHGVAIETDVDRRRMQLRVLAGDRLLWSAQQQIEAPAYHFGEWLRTALPDLLAQQESKDEQKEVDSSA